MSEIGRIYPFFKGRVALHAILKAAGIGEGDQVLLPGFTCVVVPNAINYTGAEPVYVDISLTDFNLDPDQLPSPPDRARALMVQHTYGIPCAMEPLLEYARRHDLLVIEDSCHTLGSRWRGEAVGTLGDAAFFSSQWSKPVTTGLGGWAVINDPRLAEAFRQVVSEYRAPGTGEALMLELQYMAFSVLNQPRLFWAIQGLYRTLGKLGLAIGSSSGAELACELPVDYQKAMHPTQEKRLRRLLKALPDHVRRRQENTALIVAGLQEAGLPTVALPSESEAVILRYPVLVADKPRVLAEARRRKILLGDWFLSPIHPNEDRWELAGYSPGSCPNAEYASRHVVNIPTGPGLTPREISRIIDFLRPHGLQEPRQG